MRVGPPGAAHHDVAAVGKRARGLAGRIRGREPAEPVEAAAPEEPEGLGSHPAAGRLGVVGSPEPGGRGAEQPAQIVRRPPGQRQQPAPIGVAEHRHRSLRVRRPEQEVEQPLHPLRDAVREHAAAARGQDQRVQVDLCGIALVAGALLEVDAVVEDLPLGLLGQDARAALRPAGAVAAVRQQQPGVEQPERLAGEVSVGREVAREVALDVRGVVTHHGEQLSLEARRQGLAEQRQRPQPGDQPQRHLQAARPVDASPARVRGRPPADRPDEGPAPAFVACEPIRLPERHQPLVAAELPLDLAVSNLPAVEHIQPAPVHERRAHAGHRVELPVQWIAEREALVAEQIEAAGARTSGPFHQRGRGLRLALAHQRGGGGIGRAGEEALAVELARGRRVAALPRQRRALEPLEGLLAPAVHDLGGGHAP